MAMRSGVTGRWQVTRTNGERVIFEAATEREAGLLARESFPEDDRFELALLSMMCARCRAVMPAAGRCELCRARREARKRGFIVHVAFLVKAGWTARYEARVKAFTPAGAAALGVREAKRARVKPRARVSQVRLEVIRM
jgi:hypothetical protein